MALGSHSHQRERYGGSIFPVHLRGNARIGGECTANTMSGLPHLKIDSKQYRAGPEHGYHGDRAGLLLLTGEQPSFCLDSTPHQCEGDPFITKR
jgi:hypothetical protein